MIPKVEVTRGRGAKELYCQQPLVERSRRVSTGLMGMWAPEARKAHSKHDVSWLNTANPQRQLGGRASKETVGSRSVWKVGKGRVRKKYSM